ncbi:MAG: hypothetical protein WA103_03150 [Minisyncoccales bacterium]
MSKIYVAGMLIAFLVACSVGSAQERKVEFSEPGIGAFSFVADHDEFAISNGDDVMVANGVKYPFRLGSVQVWDENKTMGAYVSLSHFDRGKPPVEVEKSLFVKNFIASSGEMRGKEPISTDVAGHNATIWQGVGMPYMDAQKRLRHFSATIIYIDINESMSMAIGAEEPLLSQITGSLVV